MTINTTSTSTGPYTGNNASDTYVYDFKVQLASEIVVVETDLSGVQTILGEGTNFSVTGVGNNGGGNVVRTAGNLPTGYTWLISRLTAQTQDADFPGQGAFTPLSHENAFDKLTQIVQEVDDKTIDLPSSTRAGNLYSFDSSGDSEANIDADAVRAVVAGALATGVAMTVDSFTGDGSTKGFTMSISPPSVNSILATIDGVMQLPTTDFSVSAATVTFVTAPPNNTSVVLRNIGNTAPALAIDSTNVSHTPSWNSAVIRNVQIRLMDNMSVKDFGAIGDGVSDDTLAIQAAIDEAISNSSVGSLFFPAGNYLVSTTLTVDLTGASDEERIKIYGEGTKSTITSTVIGASTLEINDGSFVTVERLRFVGNDLTGASGNGHAIAFRDSLPQSGTFYPAQCDVVNCRIEQFRGNDFEITGVTTGVATISAGIYIGPGLGNYVDRCSIVDCGTGIHFDETQNSHISGCLISICDDWGIELDRVNDSCSIKSCDIVTCGLDTNGDPKVFSGTLNYAGILSRSLDVISISDCKFKNGQSVSVWDSEGCVISNNYLRCDAPTVVAETWAVQADIVGSIKIDGNTFEYLAGTGVGTANAIDIQSKGSYPCTTNVSNNRFNHAEFGGYDVRYKGVSASDSEFIITHIGNSHGASRNGRTNSIVSGCIVFDTLEAYGQISGNDFTVTGDGVSAGGTITDCLDLSAIGSNIINSSIKVFGNKARIYLLGGTITNDIDIFQDRLPGTFADSDATPDVSWKSVWHTGTVTDTITDFDGFPPNGKLIVISEAAITYDVTGTALHGGTVDIVTAAGDVTEWVLDVDGFSWRLVGFMDDSVDNSAGA